jgi:hypothetical protein
VEITLDPMLGWVGKLDDSPGEDTARERFRRLLREDVNEVGQTRDYVEECLRLKADQYNRALQDLVSRVGEFLSPEIVNGRHSVSPLAVAVVSLAVALASFAFTLWYNLAPGTVRPLTPSGYCIIRGIGSFPSDHLVISIEWENSSGRPVLVRLPYLRLRSLGSGEGQEGKELRFFMAGEYPEISSRSFAEHYAIGKSFVLEPRSITPKVLVFHIQDWWDEESTYHDFRFSGGDSFHVYIGFDRNLAPQGEVPLFTLFIYGAADDLDRAGESGYWWDFWPLED